MQNARLIKALVCAIALLATTACQKEQAQMEAAPAAASDVSPEEARSIAKEAYIYANPLVDAYRAMFTWFLDEQGPEYKAPLNQIGTFPGSSRMRTGRYSRRTPIRPTAFWRWICVQSHSS
jgi:hypothetical protein